MFVLSSREVWQVVWRQRKGSKNIFFRQEMDHLTVVSLKIKLFQEYLATT